MIWPFKKNKPQEPTDPMVKLSERFDMTEPDWLAKWLVDTMLPHSQTPSPFSVDEMRHHMAKQIKEFSPEDRLILRDLMLRNIGKRYFNVTSWEELT